MTLSPTQPLRAARTPHIPTEQVLRGLTVRLAPMPGAHSVAACLTVRCGSRDDAPGPAGAAHLAEHLRVVAEAEVDRAAVPVFARTDIARTYFQAIGPPEAVPAMIRRLVGILCSGTDRQAPAAVLEAERQAVCLETRRMDINPLLRAGPLFAAAAATEPGMDAIGRTTLASIGAVTADQVTALVADRYRPTNAVLCLAGPPAALTAVTDLIAAALPESSPRLGARPAAVPIAPAATDVLCVPELDGLVALTLIRSRADHHPDPHALLADAGPLVEAGRRIGLPLLGRTTISNADQQADVLCWRPETRAEQLLDALRAVLAAPRRGLTDQVVERVRRIRRQEEQFTRATPLGRALAVADRDQAATPAAGAAVPALWQVERGRATAAA
ncbi:hypothetical protein [Kitasatospora sp. NBC_01266]|uniref:hypothetical protein n=1 Tax=Kitasatospora sp. NBC_01266 TaxID=2903572 RepID=UPI002E33CF88|nr:hypothetical protein [Kitasatospora sp. NBC_01266]